MAGNTSEGRREVLGSVMCRWARGGLGRPPSSTLEALLDHPLCSSSSSSPPIFMMGTHSSSVAPPSSHPSHFFFAAAAAAAAAAAGSFNPSSQCPPMPPFFLPYATGWHNQFRRMSPNMLMAIDAVRSGRMGFTQAGKTFGVNGRTLWVYYRKLGYEVHNTFRGKKSRPPSVLSSRASTPLNTTGRTPIMPPNPPSFSCTSEKQMPNSVSSSVSSEPSPLSCSIPSSTPFPDQTLTQTTDIRNDYEVTLNNISMSVPNTNLESEMMMSPFGEDVKIFEDITRHLNHSQNVDNTQKNKSRGTSVLPSIPNLNISSNEIGVSSSGVSSGESSCVLGNGIIPHVPNQDESSVNMTSLEMNVLNESNANIVSLPNYSASFNGNNNNNTSNGFPSLPIKSQLQSGMTNNSGQTGANQSYCRYTETVHSTFSSQNNLLNCLYPSPFEHPQLHSNAMTANPMNSFVENAAKTAVAAAHANFINSNVDEVAQHISSEDGNTIESILESCNFRNMWGNSL